MSAQILAPRGSQILADLPLDLLRLPTLLPHLSNGLITVKTEAGQGMLLVYAGEITASVWVPPDNGGPLTGAAAVDAWSEVPGSALLTAETLAAEVVQVLPMLWSNIPFDPRIRIGHLVELAAFVDDQATKEHQDKMVAISIESADHYGASLYQRGKHLLSYTDEGGNISDLELITRFKDDKSAYVGVQVAELSRAWLPLSAPRGWDESSSLVSAQKQTELPVPEPTFPLPTPPESIKPPVEKPAKSTPDALPLATSEPDDPLDSKSTPKTAKLETAPPPESPLHPQPIELETLAPTASDVEASPVPRPGLPLNSEELEPLVEEEADTSAANANLGSRFPGLLDQDDLEAEAKARVASRKSNSEADDMLQTPLSVLMLKLPYHIRQQLPDYAAEQLINDLYQMSEKGDTLEDAISMTSHLSIKGVTQSQLNALVASWTDSAVTGS